MTRSSIPRPTIRGFTLLELLVSLTILSLILLLTVPAFFSYNARRKLEGTAEQAAVLLRKARYDAITRGSAVMVAADVGQGVLFLDRDGDQVLDPVEHLDGVVRLPTGLGFGGPASDSAGVVGFEAMGGSRVALFEPNGSLRSDSGAFRLHDDRDNFLEVRVTDPATALVVLRKWQDGAWQRKDQDGEAWTWNL